MRAADQSVPTQPKGGDLGVTWGSSGAMRGSSWGHPEVSWELFFLVESLTEPYLGVSRGSLGPTWVPLGGDLDPSGGHLRHPVGDLGHTGRVRDHPGVQGGPLGGPCAPDPLFSCNFEAPQEPAGRSKKLRGGFKEGPRSALGGPCAQIMLLAAARSTFR